MPDLKNISIIGLGLIGSSIARTVKKNNPKIHISAFDSSVETINTAISTAIIDKGYHNPADAVKDADMVILCTPIGSYGEITAKIAKNMKKGAIISDVGSVKAGIMDEIKKYLSPEQIPLYIPAHPIAGSEKSGIMAGTDNLFKGRQLILTPTSDCDKTALENTRQFWQNCGSIVDIMDAKEHDMIYAASSHLPHLISFCFANLLAKLDEKTFQLIKDSNNSEFKGFIRLAGSNPMMWQDIFLFNSDAVLAQVENFYSPPAICPIDGDSDIESLYNRILAAQEKRRSTGTDRSLNPILYSFETYAFMELLPKIIACLSIESVKDFSHVGGGFLGLTRNILTPAVDFSNRLNANKVSANSTISQLQDEIEIISALIRKRQVTDIYEYIASAVKIYENLN